MKRILFAVLLSTLIGSGNGATPKSEKATKPWYSVPRADVRITVERWTDKMKREEVLLYGNGVAVWNNSVQFRLDEPRVKRMLAAFDAAHFEDIPQGEEGEHLRLRAGILAGDYRREVFQTWEEAQEREEKHEGTSRLEKFVGSLMAIVKPVANKGGTSAASLTDGLKKTASGQLAPETLSLILLIKPDIGRSQRHDGSLLRIEDGFASSSLYSDQGFSKPTRIKLSESQIRDIATRLVSFDPETFPNNLYATDYEDLTIMVLNRRKNVLARQFAGTAPTKYGERQKRFDSMIQWLDETRRLLFAPTPKQ